MEARDFIVTPLYLIIIYVGAYLVRPFFTDSITRRYFLPALTVKLIGALCVGLLYQFYYGGGDTFMYHSNGSRVIWEAFTDSATTGLRLLFAGNEDQTGIYEYSSQIYFFRDPQSYAVIRLAALFDLLTFSTYSATALLFAVLSFAGMWMFFLTFYEQFPDAHRGLALAAFFIPSVFFWGSGLLKDTVTLACLGAASYCTYRTFLKGEFKLSLIIILILSLYGMYVIKIYILLTFLPAAVFWLFLFHLYRIRSMAMRVTIFPFVIILAATLAFYAMVEAGEDNPKYALNMISKTAQVTAFDIRYWSGRDAGSGYALGQLDGTWQSLVRLAPEAIVVSLFRPYPWEVKNPLMALMSIESLLLGCLTIYVLFSVGWRLFGILMRPSIFFALLFSLVFAFAVGVSTFNFGTLSRYKIPLLPFYLVALVLILNHSKRERKVVELELIE